MTITQKLPIAVLFFVAGFKWLFEGVLDMRAIEIALLAFGLFCALITSRYKFDRYNTIFFLYCIPILISCIGSGDKSIVGLGIILICILLYQILVDWEIEEYVFAIRCIELIAIINCVLIIAQYLFTDFFNGFYFPYLRDSSLIAANRYMRSAHYFGVYYTPEVPAAFIICAIAYNIISFRTHTRIQKNWLRRLFVIAFLIIGLLLTGKKGVLFTGAFAIMLVLLVKSGSRKDMAHAFVIVVGFVVAGALFSYVVAISPDNPLLFRFNQFLANLVQGDDATTGRTYLIQSAMELWNSNFLFGVGWKRFSGLTVTALGYQVAHEVNCDYIQFLCETGVVGFALMVIPILAMFRRTILLCRRYFGRGGLVKSERVVFFAVFVQFFIVMYAFVEIPFYDFPIFAIYIVSCCIVNSTCRRLEADCAISADEANSVNKNLRLIGLWAPRKVHR